MGGTGNSWDAHIVRDLMLPFRRREFHAGLECRMKEVIVVFLLEHVSGL